MTVAAVIDTIVSFKDYHQKQMELQEGPMRHYEVRQISPNNIQLIFRRDSAVSRMLTIKIGDTYWVQPDNPQKLKHRGRQCIVKNFHMDDLGNYVQAIVTFLDNNRTGRVDLEDLVVEYSECDTGKSEAQVPRNDAKLRYLPEEVPDFLFTRNELKSMGCVPTQEAAAYVSYPEQKKEYPLFHIEETKLTKRQSGLSLIRKDCTIEEVMEKRKNALEVRKKQQGNYTR